MSAPFLPEFTQEPNKPHQRIWVNEETGVRCRSYASHNSYTCHHHIIPDMPPVFSNDAFPIERAETRESIQTAVADVLVRIAANEMDLKRAAILLYGLQIASTNLRTKVSAPAPDPPPTPPTAESRPLKADSQKPTAAPAATGRSGSRQTLPPRVPKLAGPKASADAAQTL